VANHAYYNEIDPAAAQWLRNLIEAGHIAPGCVDERSIEDVYPSDLRGFTQCHFFAGVGVWSHAMRSAGWADDRPVWTGSCPCQPFSSAGKGAGFDDERHLWPAFHHLIRECKPAVVIGEQVASKDSDPWIDLVHTDMEALGYAFGAIPFPSAGVGAPHIRDRLYWVGHAGSKGLAQRERVAGIPCGPDGGNARKAIERAGVCDGGMADHNGDGCQPGRKGGEAMGYRQTTGADRGSGGVADDQLQQRPDWKPGICNIDHAGRWIKGSAASAGLRGDMRTSPTNGFWRDADWLFCRDNKWRPVEPGSFPLVDGAAARVVRLRAYGNAINAKAAQAFIECLM